MTDMHDIDWQDQAAPGIGTALLSGKFSPECSMIQVLEMIQKVGATHGMLRILSKTGSGYIGMFCGSAITGAHLTTTRENRVPALRKLLATKSGLYGFVSLPQKREELQQGLYVSVDSLLALCDEQMTLIAALDEMLPPTDCLNAGLDEQGEGESVSTSVMMALDPSELLQEPEQSYPLPEIDWDSPDVDIPSVFSAWGDDLPALPSNLTPLSSLVKTGTKLKTLGSLQAEIEQDNPRPIGEPAQELNPGVWSMTEQEPVNTSPASFLPPAPVRSSAPVQPPAPIQPPIQAQIQPPIQAPIQPPNQLQIQPQIQVQIQAQIQPPATIQPSAPTQPTAPVFQTGSTFSARDLEMIGTPSVPPPKFDVKDLEAIASPQVRAAANDPTRVTGRHPTAITGKHARIDANVITGRQTIIPETKRKPPHVVVLGHCLTAALILGVITGGIFFTKEVQRVQRFKQEHEVALHFLKNREFDRALPGLSKLVESDYAHKSTARIQRALAFAGLGNFDLAISDYNFVLAEQPDNQSAKAGRALCYMKGGNYEAAIRDCNEVIALDPKKPSPYLMRALAYAHQGDLQKAEADCAKAAEITGPGDPKVHGTLGYLAFKKGDFAKAVDEYSLAISADSKVGDFHAGRAECYRRLGKKDDAIADSTQALFWNPHNISVLVMRAQCQYEKGNRREALDDLQKAAKIAPCKQVLEARADIFVAEHNYKAAYADLENVVQLNPADLAARNRLNLIEGQLRIANSNVIAPTKTK